MRVRTARRGNPLWLPLLLLAKQVQSKYANTNIIKQPSHEVSSFNRINKAAIEARNKLNICLVSLGFIIPGYLVYPPLLLIGIFPLLYITIGRFKSAYTALFIEKRLRIDVVDSFWLTGALANGYYFWVAVGLSIYFFSEKILAETEDSSRKNLINVQTIS